MRGPITKKETESFNAGYHYGLNTEYHDVGLNSLYQDWLTEFSYTENSLFFFKRGYAEGIMDYLESFAVASCGLKGAK